MESEPDDDNDRSPSTVIEGYDLSTDPDVVTYLRQYPWLVPLLDEVRGEIDRRFGSDARVRFEAVTDFEEGDHALFVRVKTSLALDDIRPREDAFWETWLFEALPKDGHLLPFDVLSA